MWWERLFSKEKRIQGKIVDLVEESHLKPNAFYHDVETIYYSICLHQSDEKVGRCDLRIGFNEELYYAGNIGYHIYTAYRGHGYAYEATKLLMDVAHKEFDMKELIITCSPDNIASKKTLEKLNGELLETTSVPTNHWLYKRGETVKNIYKYRLK